MKQSRLPFPAAPRAAAAPRQQQKQTTQRAQQLAIARLILADPRYADSGLAEWARLVVERAQTSCPSA